MRDDVLMALDAAAVAAFAQAALEALDASRAEIDALNVFPVPDSDTGTNLCLTLRAGVEAVALCEPADAREALAELARGAVLGARGNSGVIVAQLLRGLAEAARPGAPFGAAELRAGLSGGVELAYGSVATPVEGTVLTVARAAAEAVGAGVRLADGVAAALAAADAALDRTPDQLVALGRAGVVDAGGQGFLLILDALARTVDGRPTAPPRPLAAVHPHHLGHPARAGNPGFQYEVQYLVEAHEAAASALREQLTGLGDSVVVAGTGGGSWNVHAHVDDVGAAIEAGVAAGATRNISVVRFADQIAGRPSAGSSAVVALVEGEGLARLFAREGVSAVDAVSAGSAGDTGRRVVSAAAETGAREVVLLPNDPQATTLAETAAEQLRTEGGTRVVVIPTRSPVQGLAAVAVHDGKRRFDDDVVAMAEAAAATRFAEVSVAEGRALTSVGMCEAGDVLGLIDGDVVEIGDDVLGVALRLLDRLLGVGGELVTVLLGPNAPHGADSAVTGRVRERSPLTDVCVYRAGPPEHPLILGVE